MVSCSLMLWCVLLKSIWKLPLPQLMSLLFLRVMSRLEELCSQLLSLRGQISRYIEEKFSQFLFQLGTCQAAETYLWVSTSSFDYVFWMESFAQDSLLKISQPYLQDSEDSYIMDCLQTSFFTFFNAFFMEPTDSNLQLSFVLLLEPLLTGYSSLLRPCKSLRYFTQFMNLFRSPTFSFRSCFSSLSFNVIKSLPFILFLQNTQRQAFISMVSRKSSTSFMPHSFRFLVMNESCANLERQQYFIRKVISSSLILGCIFQKLLKSMVLNLSLSKLSVGNSSSQLCQGPSSICSLNSPLSYTSSYNFFFSASQSCPLPHFTPSLNSPIQYDELFIVSFPLPSCLSFCHSPSYCMFSQLQICIPRPYFMPLTHSPRQKSPFAQSIEPVPFGTPFSSSPQQRSALVIILHCMDSLGVFMERIVAGAWTSLAGVWLLGYLRMSLVCLGSSDLWAVGRSSLQHILKRNIL